MIHTPSIRFYRLDPLSADLMRLSFAISIEAKEIISALADKVSTIDWYRAFRTHAGLFAHLRKNAAPPPSKDEPSPVKGELLMYGGLACNMKCAYCSSRDAREKATKGEAPRLMPIETAQRSIRFIAERMAGKAEHIYINFNLGGEPLLFQERYRELRD